VTESAPDQSPQGGFSINRELLRPKNWSLWRHPNKAIIFLLTMEFLSIPALIFVFAHSGSPHSLDWIRFGILTIGATVHIQFTQRQEERRRAGTKTVIIDLTAVWSFPAALILPPQLSILLIVLIRMQKWVTGRRPAHIFVFGTIAQAITVSFAHLTYLSLGPHSWDSISLVNSFREFGFIALTALVHEIVQIIYIGPWLALKNKTPTLRQVLGSKTDNLLELVTTGLGAINAVLLVTMPLAVGIMAVITVLFSRLAELEQLQNDARTDPKTQVFNMRGWSEFAERAIGRAIRSRTNVALLMIDLDHFKSINDSYGHPAGDDVLRIVAQKIDETTRPSDVVGRFGGEEFLVLLPDTNRVTASGAAERIRSTIAELRIATTNKRGEQTTISHRTTSIGVALYPENGGSLQALVHAADNAVYEAKEAGRNRVRVATERFDFGQAADPWEDGVDLPEVVERRKSRQVPDEPVASSPQHPPESSPQKFPH
jgi:diguanylate cyclase (GGDEF)-like protein